MVRLRTTDVWNNVYKFQSERFIRIIVVLPVSSMERALLFALTWYEFLSKSFTVCSQHILFSVYMYINKKSIFIFFETTITMKTRPVTFYGGYMLGPNSVIIKLI